jgi:1-acyl-sn-glycerol-3-phosphate acyltransferase
MLRRSPFSTAQSLLYALNYVLVRILWRAKVVGEFPVKPDEGAIIVCNHRSSMDPCFLALAVPRAIHWLVAREYYEYPLFGWLLRLCELIPVDRGGRDIGGTREAVRMAQQGGLVGIFPEGRINISKQLLLPGHSGVALVALKARVPVVPCYIHGSPYDGTTLGALLMPAAVRLVIGEPIDLSADFEREHDRQTLDEITSRFMDAIAALASQCGVSAAG